MSHSRKGDKVRQSESGKDERSLIKLPFTLPGRRKRQTSTIRSKWEGEDENGSPKEFYKVVTGSDDRGLPAHPAEDVYIGLLYHSATGPSAKQEVRIPTRSLLKLMQWGTGGRAYRRLKRSLEELVGVTVRTNALWDPETESYVEAGFHIIERYRFKKVKDAPLFGEYEQQVVDIKWSDELYDYFKRARFKFLKVDTYYGLPSPLAKRLYRWLDDRIYKSKEVQIDVRHLAHTRLELSRSLRYPSQIMQKLEPALNQLQERGIANWRLKKSQTDSGKKLVFTKPKPNRPELSSYETDERNDKPNQKKTANDRFEGLSEKQYRAVRQMALTKMSAKDRAKIEESPPSPLATAQLITTMEDLLKEHSPDDILQETAVGSAD